MKVLNSNTVELHYSFTDNEHRIDAFVQNRCEHELLSLMKELTKYFEIEFSIETELTQAGGIRKYFKLKPNNLSKKDKKQIDIAVRTAICTALITSFVINPLSIPATKIISNLMDKILEDKELAEIEKEKAREELKSLKLDNIKKQQEIESNAQLKISRSNFYEILNDYDRLDFVEFSEEDEQKNKIIVYQKIPQTDFDKYIIQQDTLEDEIIENAMVAIVSPVLSKNIKNIKWKGYYNGELVSLVMKSEEFVTSVDEGLIEGFRLIQKDLLNILKNEGLEVIESDGEIFDPNFHEAIATEPSDKEAGTILETLQKGYKFNDKVLRASIVKVSQ